MRQLKEADIPVWSDIEINAGNIWFSEIEKQLRQSFALIVIVSNTSLESHWVTFEWAWALGRDILVIPLIVEELTKEIHIALAQCQYQKLNDDLTIPDKIIHLLKQQNQNPPFFDIFADKLRETLTPILISLRVYTWVYFHSQSKIVTSQTISELRAFNMMLSSHLVQVELYTLLQEMPSRLGEKFETYFDKVYQIIQSLHGCLSESFIKFSHLKKETPGTMEELEKLRKQLLDSIVPFGHYSVSYLSLDEYLKEASIFEENTLFDTPPNVSLYMILAGLGGLSNKLNELHKIYSIYKDFYNPEKIHDLFWGTIQKLKQVENETNKS